MAKFVQLLYDDPTGWDKLTPQQRGEEIQKYMEYGKKPYIRGGERLESDPGRVLRGPSTVTDGPYSETKEMLGGYYIIEAANYDEAVKYTLEHPHLGHGTIELRHLFGT